MKIVAHRGASRAAPENTLAAIRAAALEGADGVELDVRLTRDAEPVLMHDPDLLRTAGDPRPVAHCLLTDLAALDASAWFGRDYAGERIPHLEEALTAAAGFQIINLDLKSDPGTSTELADRVLAVVADSPTARFCRIVAADSLILARCRERAPHIPVGRLVESSDTPWQPDGLSFLSVREDLIDEPLLRRAADRGLEVWAWTVNDPDRARQLAQAGVAVVITDVPALLRPGLTASAEPRN